MAGDPFKLANHPMVTGTRCIVEFTCGMLKIGLIRVESSLE